jgi:hypothetical protein
MLAESRAWAACRWRGDRPLIEDPIALFSSEWLAERFDMHVVVVIRHPAAFVSSITRLGWRHPLAHFLEQPLLMRDVLAPFTDAIRGAARRTPDLVDEAALLWRIIHHAIARFRERHPAPVGSEETLQRASAQNLSNWQRRLSAAEIARIRANAADVAGAFYSDAEW